MPSTRACSLRSCPPGHDVVAVDLPCEHERAGLSAYADAVVRAIGDRTDLTLVAQSFGGVIAGRVPRRD